MNAILMSIQSQWLVKILNGEKTIEVRKSPIKEGTKVYAYCTKAKPYLKNDEKVFYTDNLTNEYFWKQEMPSPRHFNGLVVCEFIVDKCDKYEMEWYEEDIYKAIKELLPPDEDGDVDVISVISNEDAKEEMLNCDLLKKSCLSFDELGKYACGKKGGIHTFYAWHISQLKVYDKPKELREFYKRLHYPNGMWIDKNICVDKKDWEQFRLTKAPRSWCYVERGKVDG